MRRAIPTLAQSARYTVQSRITQVLRLRLRLRSGLNLRNSVFATILLLNGCHSVTPAEAIKLMHDKTQPDARREGIAALVTRWDLGKRPEHVIEYRDLAQNDPDVTVRAMAIRALNVCRDKSSTKVFITALSDENDLIRLESVKALANVPDPDAIPFLIQMLNGSRIVYDPQGTRNEFAESQDIRIAAATALGQYKEKVDVSRALVEHLNITDFGIAWQCHQSLIALTGKDLHYDETAWLQYLVGKAAG